MRCERCGRKTFGSIMSRFNTEQICFDCEAVEEQHPRYQEAVERELEAVKGGDFNFPGIGLPPELRGGA